jgi:hypothetical protein
MVTNYIDGYLGKSRIFEEFAREITKNQFKKMSFTLSRLFVFSLATLNA